MQASSFCCRVVLVRNTSSIILYPPPPPHSPKQCLQDIYQLRYAARGTPKTFLKKSKPSGSPPLRRMRVSHDLSPNERARCSAVLRMAALASDTGATPQRTITMPAASLLMRSSTAKCCVQWLRMNNSERHGLVHKKQRQWCPTCDRMPAAPSFDGACTARGALLGAEEGQERDVFGVAACRDAALTTLALSMTGLSAIYDPTGVSTGMINKLMQQQRAGGMRLAANAREWHEKEPTFDGAKLTTRRRKL